jgi:hypothetical protein
MQQFICGWVVAFVLIFLTTFFARVPKNILGSIIIVSVSTLVEYEEAIYLWKVRWRGKSSLPSAAPGIDWSSPFPCILPYLPASMSACLGSV